MAKDPITGDPGTRKRVARFLASGRDPRSSIYNVGSERLLAMVRGVEGVSDGTKDEMIALLREKLIRARKVVGSFELGIFLGRIYDGFPDKEGLGKIIIDVKDLNKLPYEVETSN